MYIYNNTFSHNQAFSYSNAVNLNIKKLEIKASTFLNNTLISKTNVFSFGGAIYALISDFQIYNTSFINNTNFIGGAIFVEQHQKYTNFIGRLEGVIGAGNSALDDCGFLYLSSGLIKITLILKFSYFKSNFGTIRNQI